MNELMLTNQNEVSTIDSREVAEMMGKKHGEVLQYLEGLKDKNGKDKVVGIIPTLTDGGLQPLKYFIESQYIDAKGESRKCYLVSKMGCELLANKMTGTKGILFSAKYVERFNEMEKQLKSNLYSYMIDDPVERALKWAKEMKQTQLIIAEKNEIIEELSPLAKIARERIDTTGTVSFTDVQKSFELKRGQIGTWAKSNGYIHKTISEVNEKGREYFKIVSYDGIHKSIAITEDGIKLIDKNINDIRNSPCRYKI